MRKVQLTNKCGLVASGNLAILVLIFAVRRGGCNSQLQRFLPLSPPPLKVRLLYNTRTTVLFWHFSSFFASSRW